MTPQVLIADNNPNTLRTTSEFFEIAGFNIIPVESPRAAELVIKYNSALAAIVLDGRLTKDENEKDRSGWQLAEKTSAGADARAPIIIYSMFEDRARTANGSNGMSRISFVSKHDGPEALIDKVKEQISLR